MVNEVKVSSGGAVDQLSDPSLFKKILAARETRILAIILVVSVGLSVTTPYFLTQSNLNALGIGLVTDAVIAIAMTMILIAGGFDLSVGSVLALSGVIVANLLHGGVNLPTAVLVTFACAAFIGLINGVVITKIKVNPLITTLGMMSIAASITLVISGGAPIANLPRSFLFLGQGKIFSIPVSVLVVLTLIIIADILLRRTRWLRLLYYIGGNERAALLSGIPVDRVRILIYIFCSVMAGFAGIIATSRLSSAFPLAGAGTEMRVISACVIGGCSLAGGEGSVWGSLLGVLLMAIINNGLVLLNVSVYWQGIVSGLILIVAVAFDMLSRRRQI